MELSKKGLQFKTLAGVVISCMTVLGMGLFIYKKVLEMKAYQNLLLQTEEKVSSVKELQLQITDMEAGIRAYLLGGRSQDLEPFAKTEGLFDTHYKNIRKRFAGDAEIEKSLDKVLKIKQEWIEAAAVSEMLARRKLTAGIIDYKQFSEAFIKSKGNALIASLKGEVASIVATIEAQMNTYKENMKSNMDQILVMVLGGVVLSVLFSFIIQYWISHSVNKSFDQIVNRLVETSLSLYKHGMSSKTDSLKLKDECRNLNTRLEGNASTLEEVGAMIQKTSANTDKASQLVRTSEDQSMEGRNVLKELESSLDDITKSNLEIEDSIKNKLQEINDALAIVEKIGENTKMISDIVFQTKLLSFNASVEAARAGEHGKGFSVVAEEIGNLARVSGDSATKIEHIINEAKKQLDGLIKGSLEITESLFEQNKSKLKKGESSVVRCNEKFDQVLTSVKAVSDNVVEINHATGEQASGVKEISQSASDFETTSKNCLNIAEKSLNNIEHISQEIDSMNNQIDAIKATVFGQGSGHSDDQANIGGSEGGGFFQKLKQKIKGSRKKDPLTPQNAA